MNERPPPTRCWRIAESKMGPTNVNVALSKTTPLQNVGFLDLVQKSGCEVSVSSAIIKAHQPAGCEPIANAPPP